MKHTPTITCAPVVAPVCASWSMPLVPSVARASVYGTWQAGDDRTIGLGHMGDTNNGTTGFKRPVPGFFEVTT